MCGQPEVPFEARIAGVWFISEVRGHILEVAIKDDVTVEFNFDGGAFDGDLLEIPQPSFT